MHFCIFVLVGWLVVFFRFGLVLNLSCRERDWVSGIDKGLDEGH